MTLVSGGGFLPSDNLNEIIYYKFSKNYFNFFFNFFNVKFLFLFNIFNKKNFN